MEEQKAIAETRQLTPADQWVEIGRGGTMATRSERDREGRQEVNPSVVYDRLATRLASRGGSQLQESLAKARAEGKRLLIAQGVGGSGKSGLIGGNLGWCATQSDGLTFLITKTNTAWQSTWYELRDNLGFHDTQAVLALTQDQTEEELNALEEEMGAIFLRPDREPLHKALLRAKIVMGTLAQFTHRLLENPAFGVGHQLFQRVHTIHVDEAPQMTVVEMSLLALLGSEESTTYILFGDSRQLPATILTRYAPAREALAQTAFSSQRKGSDEQYGVMDLWTVFNHRYSNLTISILAELDYRGDLVGVLPVGGPRETELPMHSGLAIRTKDPAVIWDLIREPEDFSLEGGIRGMGGGLRARIKQYLWEEGASEEWREGHYDFLSWHQERIREEKQLEAFHRISAVTLNVMGEGALALHYARTTPDMTGWPAGGMQYYEHYKEADQHYARRLGKDMRDLVAPHMGNIIHILEHALRSGEILQQEHGNSRDLPPRMGCGVIATDYLQDVKGSTSASNRQEASLGLYLAAYLLHTYPELGTITVLCPYEGQRDLVDKMLRNPTALIGWGMLTPALQERLAGLLRAIRTPRTVDSSQGSTSNATIVMLSRSGGNPGFLAEWNRTNVLKSRARALELFIGHASLFETCASLKAISMMLQMGGRIVRLRTGNSQVDMLKTGLRAGFALLQRPFSVVRRPEDEVPRTMASLFWAQVMTSRYL